MVGRDAQLKVLSGEGREPDLEGAMELFESPLLRYATRLLHGPDAAQDVVQDAFIKLHKAWKNGAEPPKDVKCWLYRVTHNLAVDFIRKESRLRALHKAESEEPQYPLQTAEERQRDKQEKIDMVLELVDALKPEEQQVVLLRLQEGLSYKEIAEITRRSEGNVGCILHHAVKKLSETLRLSGAVT